MVGDGELYKEKRNVLREEMRKTDGCAMEKFGTLDGSEKTIAILLIGDRWWPQTAKEARDKISRNVFFIYILWKKRTERPSDGGFSTISRSRNGAPSRKGYVVNGLMSKASNI